MIEWISNWAETIVIAVIIATIIEMILPEGSSKKYIKVVIGVYILFTIVSPVITRFTGKSLAVSDTIDLNKYIDEVKEKERTQNPLQEDNSASIREIYIGNLKADIKNKLKSKGYIVETIDLDVGYDDNYTLNKISLEVTKETDENTEEDDELDSDVTSVNIINDVNINIFNTNANIIQPDEKNRKDSNNFLPNSDKKKIKEYISGVYEINEKAIIVN